MKSSAAIVTCLQYFLKYKAKLYFFNITITITMFSKLAIAVLSLTAFAGASTLQINNRCPDPLYLTITNPDTPYAEPVEVKSGEAYAAGKNEGEGS